MENVRERITVSNGTKFLGVTFLYMFAALLLTALVATGVGFIFTNVLPIADAGNVINDKNFGIYIGTMIGSFICLLITSIWFSISAWRGRHSLAFPFILYATLFGVFASTFVMFVDPVTIGIAFGITCLAFGVMALLGFVIKANINFLWIVVLGIFIGAGLVALTNLIWMFIWPAMFLPVYWAIEYAIFGAVMLITMIDVWNIKKMAEHGEANNNLCLFCAFNLYVDFINIFIRILAFVARARGR